MMADIPILGWCWHIINPLSVGQLVLAPEKKNMKVRLKNQVTGELKEIKVGWSWTLFLFSGIFGLPLFLRKLNTWGFLFLALWVVNLIGPYIAGAEAAGISLVMFFIFAGLGIWLGIKGNEMTAKNYLELGWRFADPLSEDAKFARGKWGIAVGEAPPVSILGHA